MIEPLPFRRRFDLGTGPIIHDDFPEGSRIALYHILREFRDRGGVAGWEDIGRELRRLTRRLPSGKATGSTVFTDLQELDWPLVFEFVERVYSKLLTPEGYWDHEDFVERASLATIRSEFASEVNRILLEDSLGFEFTGGYFTRPGSKHYQSVTASSGKVLARPELASARLHFLKAMRFFEAAPHADPANAVKEAVMALEAAAKSLFPDVAGKDLYTIFQQLRGTSEDEVPPTLSKIAESVYAFRGAALGVTHGGATGGVPTLEVAELVLSVTASYIVYLVTLADRRTIEPPF